MQKIKIGVLISGGGSNLQAIIDATRKAELNMAEVAVVISNKTDAFGLTRAKNAGIEALFIDPKAFANRVLFYEKVVEELKNRGVQLVCLAGFLLKLEPNIIAAFPRRILNIHPGPLPRFGGKGMYGHFVHEAVIAAQVEFSAVTVHVVDEEFDHGPTVAQMPVPVLPGDTPERLAERVLKEEHLLYPQAIALYLKQLGLVPASK